MLSLLLLVAKPVKAKSVSDARIPRIYSWEMSRKLPYLQSQGVSKVVYSLQLKKPVFLLIRPLPVPNFRHIVAVLLNVMFVFN